MREADGELALDAEAAEPGPGRGGAGVQAGGGHEAGGGAGQAEIVLHALRGGADLEAAGRDGAHAGGERHLHGDAVGDGGRHDRGRQRAGGLTGLAGRVEGGGGGGGVEAAHAGRLIS